MLLCMKIYISFVYESVNFRLDRFESIWNPSESKFKPSDVGLQSNKPKLVFLLMKPIQTVG